MSDTLDLTTVSDEPVESNVQVEITDAPEEPDAEGPVEELEEAVEEPVEEPEESEEVAEPVEAEEEAPAEQVTTEEPVAPEETAGPVEEAPVETESPAEAPVSPEESVAPVEQVAADIRNILTEVPVASTDSSELSDDLKQRIAELDFLRECCGNWVGSGGRRCKGRNDFLTAWTCKSVFVDSNVNYEDTLVHLEKMPEIVKLWAIKGTIDFNKTNYFKNIETYTLGKPLFNGKSNEEKVEVLEQLINLLTDCANGKMRKNQIEEVIDNLY